MSTNPAETQKSFEGALGGLLQKNRLFVNIMHFGRALRAAGLPVGPGRVLEAVRAVEAVGVSSRTDFYWTLYAVFVNRRDQHDLFDQAFHMFWRDPKILERLLGMMMPSELLDSMVLREDPARRRVQEALSPESDQPEGGPEEEREEEVELDAAMTASAQEILQSKDFEEMSTEEIAAAKQAIKRMRLALDQIPTRRFQSASTRARIDMRATLRQAMRGDASGIPLKFRKKRTRPAPLVILCDISGSMTRYSRMFLHFMHAITNDRDRVHTFVFGTRLSNVTRHLRHKDIDVALERITGAVDDWSGGTRIGECLHDFNRFWGRRVLGQGAVVILVSDGLDRDAGRGLDIEIDRLHRSCRRLVWLNPLLRFDGFEPKSHGVRALLPHVDEFRPVHNLQSLEQLVTALNRQPTGAHQEIEKWQQAQKAI